MWYNYFILLISETETKSIYEILDIYWNIFEKLFYLVLTNYIMLQNVDFSFFLFLFRPSESSITLILWLFWLCMSNINSWFVSSSFLFCKLRFVWLNEVSIVSKCLYFWSEVPQLQEQSGGGGGGAENSGACFSKSLSKCNFNFSNWNMKQKQ